MMTTLIMLGVAAGCALALFLAFVIAVKSFYVVPRADEALVKTGGREPIVSTGGGLWVIPMFHRVTHVSLKAVKIPIERTGENALPTANKIPAEIRGELIVRVSPDDPKHVVLAAQSLGTDGGSTGGQMEEIIQQQVDSLVTDALRTAAFKKSFEKLNSEKAEFADEVIQLLANDLAKLGLVLVAVTVPYVKQGEFTKDPGDVFAAEAQRNAIARDALVVGQALARIAPANGPTSRKSGEFTGSMGVAITSITHAIGQVNVVPGEPNAPAALLNVCLDPAWPAEIGRGTEVHLVAYDASKNLYTVRPLLTV